jgi:hypothetical protein
LSHSNANSCPQSAATCHLAYVSSYHKKFQVKWKDTTVVLHDTFQFYTQANIKSGQQLERMDIEKVISESFLYKLTNDHYISRVENDIFMHTKILNIFLIDKLHTKFAKMQTSNISLISEYEQRSIFSFCF